MVDFIEIAPQMNIMNQSGVDLDEVYASERHNVLVIDEPEENFRDILSQLEKK